MNKKLLLVLATLCSIWVTGLWYSINYRQADAQSEQNGSEPAIGAVNSSNCYFAVREERTLRFGSIVAPDAPSTSLLTIDPDGSVSMQTAESNVGASNNTTFGSGRISFRGRNLPVGSKIKLRFRYAPDPDNLAAVVSNLKFEEPTDLIGLKIIRSGYTALKFEVKSSGSVFGSFTYGGQLQIDSSVSGNVRSGFKVTGKYEC